MKKEIAHNQALYQQITFFDPIDISVDMSGGGFPRHTAEKKGVVICENGDVEFNYWAPNAKSVRVSGIGGSMPQGYDLEPLRDGYWQAVVTDIVPGFHYIDFFVDGVKTVNQLAPIGYGCFYAINFFEKPDDNSEFYLLQDVPHGDLRMELYKSSENGRTKAAWVYTPPGYDENPNKKYPVLYIQHGVGENETGWVWQGKINYIADNLLAEGKMEEMVIVMNAGYAFKPDGYYMFFPGDFDSQLTKDCIPFIDSKYRTISDREHRAIAGLSLGAGQALYSGVTHMEDLFSAIGVFSCGIQPKGMFDSYDLTEAFDDGERFKKYIKLFFSSAGEQEPMLIKNRQIVKELKEQKGIDTVLFTCPGYHEWDVWRNSACEYLQRLFK